MKKNLSLLVEFLKKADLEKEAFIIEQLFNSSPVILLDKNEQISDGLKYHIENKLSLTQPVFREGSSAHFDLIKEARDLYSEGKLFLDKESEEILQSDIGKFAEYNGQLVPLEFPMPLEEEESILKMAAEYKGKNVQLNKPRYLRKGEPGFGRKKSVVYVKDGDRVKRITFGDPNLKTRAGNAQARKNFRARHNCKSKKDKTSAGYWACRFPPNW
jgi:hypothetical protein